MKYKLLTALMLSAGVIAAPSVAFAAAADLNSCCTPGDKDFPKVGGNLGNQNYSSLRQITRINVKQLGGAWLNHVEGGLTTGTNQSTPVVVDGVIYLETALANVIAVDGKTGATKWKWISKDGNTRRGVAVAKDLGLVYTLSEQSLVAIDIATGVEKWRKTYPTSVGNVDKVAVVYHDKRVYIGTNDGNRGTAIMADATNGDLLTSFKSIPAEGEFGYDTWGGATEANRAGATPWLHPAVDPELGLVYWTFGNVRGGSSQNGSARPGLNLFGDSIVALDLKTGERKWHFQSIHHDIWDMDNVQPPVLMDVPINGVMRKMLAYGSKTGMYYMLDRTDGSAPLGIDEIPVPQDPRQASWPTQPFPRQGGYTEQCAIWEPLGGPVPGNPSRAVPNYPLGCLYAPHWDGPPVLSFPGHGGAADWSHRSFSQTTKLVYTGMGYVGASHSLNEGSNGLRPPGEYQTGAVVAVDPSTNLVRWKKLMPYSLAHGNGILTTATDVLFIGQPDGNLIAMDATSGRELWRFQTGAAISASPITYEIDGVQYVAVYGGGTGIPYGNSAPRGDNLWALKVGGTLPPAPTPTPPEVRRPVSGSAVTGASVSNTVLLGRSSATAAEQSINSGNTNGMFPTWMTVPVGTTVTFTNPASSVNAHCATQFFEGLFNFRLNPGQSATYTFTQAGEFFFNDCHNPRSTGKVVVQ